MARRRRSSLRRSAPPVLTPKHGEPMDRTLILVKPDAFARNLTGEIIARFERKGLRLVSAQADDAQPRARRAALRRARRASRSSASWSTSSPAARSSRWRSRAMRPSSPRRQMIGATNPLEAATGSIRGDFALEVGSNMVHGSDSTESAERANSGCSSRTCGRSARSSADPDLDPRPRFGQPPAAGDPRRSSGSPTSCDRRPRTRSRTAIRTRPRPRTRAARPRQGARR